LSELASLAEQYLDAHASNKEWPRKPMFRDHLSPTSERKFGSSGRSERIIKPEVGRECFNCGKTGHLAKDCRTAPTCVRCGKWVTLVGTVNWPQDVSTVGKLGIPLETVFTPRD